MSVGATDKTISASDGTVGSSEEDLPAGTAVGEYVLESKLGEGGFGAVYKAMHPVIGKAAAVKVLHRSFSSNAEIVARFIAEARSVNQIRHRNIVDIFSFGRLPDGRQYYVMELLEGAPLDKHLERVGRMDVATALPILRGIAKALDAAHGHGIVHRDLKPENVFLVTQDDGTFFPKLVDFGIAKLMGNTDSATSQQHQKTRTGTLIGTPYYMSPEQCRGIGVDHRTDIYAFGVMVHRVLSGHLPFDGQSAMDIMMANVGRTPPPLSTLVPDLPQAMDAPIQKMLAKEPGDRPQNVSSAVDALELAAGISTGTPRPMVPPSGTFTPAPSPSGNSVNVPAAAVTDMGMASTDGRKSNRSLVLAIVAVVALAAIGGGVFLLRKPGGGSSDANAGNAKTNVTATATTTSAPATKATEPSSATATAPATTPTMAAQPATVSVKIETIPKGAEIALGDKKLGPSPGPFTFPRGSEPVQVKVSAPGFATKTVPVEVASDGTVRVTLTPAAGTGPTIKKPISGDLENPF